MAGVLGKFKQALQGRPLLTNCLTYGMLYGGAEFSQQTFIRKYSSSPKQDYDMAHVGRYFVLGSTAFPTFLYYWYKFLDGGTKYWKGMTGKTVPAIAAKVVVDQLVTAPPILSTFYVGMSVMEGREDIFAEMKEKFWPTFKASCSFWVWAQAFNFAVVPSSLRVVYIGSMSFLWVNILCFLKREPVEADKEKE